MPVRALILFLFAVLVCISSYAQNEPVGPNAPQGYLIGSGDEITGKVLGEPQFDFVATVDEDGKIAIPFVDDPVVAACRTERDLRTEVNRLLSRYLRNPQTSIRVTQRNSRPPVSVYGEVRQPGQVALTRRAYLLELITHTGGETEKAGGMIQVFRTRPPMCPDDDSSERWENDGTGVPNRMYSLASLRQGRPDANPEILPGDIIIVQKAHSIFVTGEVMRPGEFSIPEGGLPLSQAIAMASGVTREARTKTVNIYRRKQGSIDPEVIEADYNAIRSGREREIMLQPNDIVDVGKARKTFGQVLYEAVIGLPGRVPLPVIRPL